LSRDVGEFVAQAGSQLGVQWHNAVGEYFRDIARDNV
jgi:hypothetical protein